LSTVSDTRRAIIIFDSRYGNTEKISMALAKGIQESGFETFCKNINQVIPDSLSQYRLIAVGAPTEMITASKSIKGFLDKIDKLDLHGSYGFAFDTKLPSRLSGSAAKYIEKKLKNTGLQMIISSSSAIVESHKDAKQNVVLRDGEESRFELIGREIGNMLAAKIGKTVEP